MTDQTAQSGAPTPTSNFSRRSLLRAAGIGAAAVGGASLLDACSSSLKGASSSSSSSASPSGGAGSSGSASGGEITIGWIHPLTGGLAGFGAPDNWVLQQVRQAGPYKTGFKIGGKTYTVNIKSYDSQSSVTHAGTLAKQAIQ